jgi:hypothetical protein
VLTRVALGAWDAGRRRDGYLDDDAVRAEGDSLRWLRGTAGYHAQRAPVELVLGTQAHAERAVPAQRVMLIGQHAQPPGAGARRATQGALDGPAAALKKVAAGREDGGGEENEHQDGGEDPYRVRQRSPHRRSARP